MDNSKQYGIISDMAKRQFKLSEREIGMLREASDKTKQADERTRLQAVRLYGEGREVSDIMGLVDCGERSLRRWVSRYEAEGVAGLKSQHYGNQNAAKMTPEQRTQVKEKLHQYQPDQVLSPDMRISRGQFWTVSDLQIALQCWYNVTYQSDNSYRTLLQASGFSLQQAENQYRSRPDEATIAEFEARLEKK